MAARKEKIKHKEKYYVYQFFSGDVCVYVGKGSGNRFSAQSRRFSEFRGEIVKRFNDEKEALSYERGLIKKLTPSHNKAQNSGMSEPWKYSIVPKSDRDFYAWCSVIGTKEMAARVVLSKPWSYLRKIDVNINGLVSKVENFCGVYYGARC